MDSSGLDALEQLNRSLRRKGKRLILCRINEQPLSLMRRAGFDAELGSNNMQADLSAALTSSATTATD
jgi:SulP family sulfate permease